MRTGALDPPVGVAVTVEEVIAPALAGSAVQLTVKRSVGGCSSAVSNEDSAHLDPLGAAGGCRGGSPVSR